ncbi:acyltransferase domain-containing protein [Streptomyces longwoodensis]|uniref:type I polyketide synthase n=1 Tax=Streptomyces longwoodensis TaxID=68231 RepID=UPI002ED09720|nr:acyltransferase domain-containing protein [Streptomyces longwoodensis]
MRASRTTERTAVAVVGMGCAFPGANGPQEFWDRLVSGTDSVTVVPADRFDIAEHCSADRREPGRTVSRHGGFLTDAYGFDAGFFGISPAEAADMDPQQRLVLQVAWESLEDAGLRPSALAGSRTGVFVGQATADYDEVHQPRDGRTTVRGAAGRRLRAVTAGRVSYALDLRGPSVVLDTACSSSLVAVHAARQSLLTGESDLALAGGVNVILSPRDALVYAQSGMLSADGRCKFGDASGDGFVRSEGVGLVVLKRLSDALRDGDPVRALLLGTAVGNDGRGSGLLLKPAESGQVAAIEEACAAAGISPAQVDYVEAHGTGTPVGDGVELAALASVNQDRDAARPLRVGSVKTNIGHPEAAAGVAGLIKAVLMAEHGVIPASLHCADPHPLLATGALPLRLVTENEPLTRNGDRAHLGVSSLGLSGTNAHAIVGEFTGVAERAGVTEAAGVAESTGSTERPERRPLLVLSARTPASLRGLARAYASHLRDRGRGTPLADLCAAAALRRDHHPFRLWVTAATHEELADRLLALARGEEIADGGTGEAGFGADRRTALVFPGQGSQWQGMGRGLLAASPAFRQALTRCAEAVHAELGWSPLELLTDDRAELPDDVQTVQPLLWAVEVALAAALREAGLSPDLCIGHSMGEAAAAHVSGALTLRDAAAVICRRSRLMSRVAGRGGMLLVGLSAEEAQQVVTDAHPGVRVAAENAPRSTVLAGPSEELARLTGMWERQGVVCHPVRVDVPSHSPVMEEVRQDLLDSLADLSPVRPGLPMISTVRGHDRVGADGGSVPDAAYWAENLCGPVRFTRAVRAAAKADDTVFVEVSPHPLLSGGISDTLRADGASGAVVPTLRRGQDEPEALARTVGQAYAAGASVDWTRWFDRATTPGVRLPTYVWDTRDYLPATSAHRPPAPGSEVRTHTVPLADRAAEAGWRDALTMRGSTPVPAVVHLLTAIDAVRDACGDATPVLRDVRLSPHVLDARDAAATALTVEVGAPGPDGTRPVSVTSTRAGETVPHADGRAAAGGATEGADATALLALLDAALARCTTYLPRHRFEALAARHGLTIGSALRSVEQLWCGDGEFVARVRRPSLPGPAAWEAGLLPLLSTWPEAPGSGSARRAAEPDTRGRHLYVPEAFGEVRVLGDLPENFWSVGTCAPNGPDSALAEVRMYTPDGCELASFTGIRLRRLPADPVPVPTPALPSAGAVAGWLTERLLPPVVSRTLHGIGSALLGAVSSRNDDPAEAGERPSTAATPFTVAEPPQSAGTDRTEAGAGPGPQQALLDRAADLLGLPASQVDVRRPLTALGLDSLMAAHLRQRLLAEHGIDVPVGRLLSPLPIADLLTGSAAA